MFKVNDFVYIRPDIAIDMSINEKGRIVHINDDLYFVTNLNMPFLGTINGWLTKYEISSKPWIK
jgi:hypothetical protein